MKNSPQVVSKGVLRAQPAQAAWKVLLLAAILMAVDFSLGPNIQFGFFYVVPVMLAAWFHGSGMAIALAVAMAIARMFFHWIWDFPVSVMTALINNVFRVAMLTLVAIAISRLSRHVRELRQRIFLLEGQLTVCRCCGVIRVEDGSWAPLNAVEQPEILPICPRCDEKHYGFNS